jgi:hypothetical protein
MGSQVKGVGELLVLDEILVVSFVHSFYHAGVVSRRSNPPAMSCTYASCQSARQSRDRHTFRTNSPTIVKEMSLALAIVAGLIKHHTAR